MQIFKGIWDLFAENCEWHNSKTWKKHVSEIIGKLLLQYIAWPSFSPFHHWMSGHNFRKCLVVYIWNICLLLFTDRKFCGAFLSHTCAIIEPIKQGHLSYVRHSMKYWVDQVPRSFFCPRLSIIPNWVVINTSHSLYKTAFITRGPALVGHKPHKRRIHHPGKSSLQFLNLNSSLKSFWGHIFH